MVVVDGEDDALVPRSREVPRIIETGLARDSVHRVSLRYWLLSGARLVLRIREEGEL